MSSWLYIPIADRIKASEIHKLLLSDEWFQMLLFMQQIRHDFKRSVVDNIRTKITGIKSSNKPLISINLHLIDQIVEDQKRFYETSHEYLSDLSNFS